jgi:hypothetical protein
MTSPAWLNSRGSNSQIPNDFRGIFGMGFVAVNPFIAGQEKHFTSGAT